MALEIDKLYVTLEAKTEKFTADLRNAEKQFEKTKKSAEEIGKSIGNVGLGFAAAGTAIVGSVGLMVDQWSKAGDEVAKMADRTGFSVKALQELRYVADLSGASLSDIEIATKRMARVLTDAASGSGEANKSLTQLGLTTKDFIGLRPDEQFNKLTTAIANVTDPTTRAALAQEIFGRSGTALLPMLSGGADGLEKLRKEAHLYSNILDDKTIQSSVKFRDDLTRLKTSFTAITQEIAMSFLPILNKIISVVQSTILSARGWIKENENLFRIITIGVGVIGGFALVLGTVLVVVGKIIAIAPMLAAAWTAVTGPVGLVVTAIAGLIAIGGLLITNWQQVSFYAGQIWSGIKIIVMTMIEKIMGAISTLFGWIPGAGAKIQEAHKSIMAAIENEEKAMTDRTLEYKKKKMEEELAERQKNANAIINTNAQINSELARQNAALREAELAEWNEYAEELNKAREQELEEERKAAEEKRQLELNRMNSIAEKIREFFADKHAQMRNDMEFAIANAEKMGLREDQIRKYYAELDRKRRLEVLQQVFTVSQDLLGRLANISSQYFKNRSLELDAYYDKEKERIENSQMTQEQKASAIKKLEEKITFEKKKAAIEQARIEKELALFSAVVNTAQAVVKALTMGPIIGPILATTIGILGAAQIALIKAQPIPSFAAGGLVYGPTIAMVGDNPGVINDPEVISPLSELKKIINTGQQTIAIYLDGKVIAKSTAEHFPRVLRLYGAVAQ